MILAQMQHRLLLNSYMVQFLETGSLDAGLGVEDSMDLYRA